MIHALKPFQSETSARRIRIDVGISRHSSNLEFHFTLMGSAPADLESVVRPSLVASNSRSRKDELWKSTCFELFFGPSDSRQYFEMNLGPSGDWNYYAFDDYRVGRRAPEGAVAPLQSVESSATGDRHVWIGRIQATDGELADVLSRPSLVVGATAVIEYKDGEREYWALAHAGLKPDFHLRESFRLVL